MGLLSDLRQQELDQLVVRSCAASFLTTLANHVGASFEDAAGALLTVGPNHYDLTGSPSGWHLLSKLLTTPETPPLRVQIH